jgi:chromosome segregation ATPase
MQISKGYSKFINFLATKALNKLKQSPDDEAIAGLNQIVGVISDIISAVNQDLAANNAANEADRATFEGERSRLENSIATTDAQIAALGTEIANVEGRLAELHAAIETNNGLIVTRTAEYNASVESCRLAEETYAANLSQRNGELQIISEVIDILTTDLSNLRRFTEETISNSAIRA